MSRLCAETTLTFIMCLAFVAVVVGVGNMIVEQAFNSTLTMKPSVAADTTSPRWQISLYAPHGQRVDSWVVRSKNQPRLVYNVMTGLGAVTDGEKGQQPWESEIVAPVGWRLVVHDQVSK